MKKIIITGSTSMLGLALIDELLKEECKIFAVCRENSLKKAKLPVSEKIKIIECNLENLIDLPFKIDEGCDMFYHFAWIESGSDRNDNLSAQYKNVEYTMNAVRVAQTLGCGRFIGAGSQAEYGESTRITDKTLPNPCSAYGISKYAAGKMAAILCERLGISYVWVRIFSVFGANDRKDTMIMQTLDCVNNGKKMPLTSGEQLWDYLYAKDAGRALALIGDRGISQRVYNLAGGNARPLKDYILSMGKALNCNHLLGLGDLSYPNGKIRDMVTDTQRLKDEIGFIPQYTFEEGFSDMLNDITKQ